MILCDVNVLIYAFRADAARHGEYREWLADRLAGHEPVGVSELVLSAVVRVVTHRAVFTPPAPLDKAFAFVDALRARRNCVIVAPGARHWGIFKHVCESAGAKGNLIADAYHAALAIEHGCEWITTDRDYARFAGLRWRHPLD